LGRNRRWSLPPRNLEPGAGHPNRDRRAGGAAGPRTDAELPGRGHRTRANLRRTGRLRGRDRPEFHRHRLAHSVGCRWDAAARAAAGVLDLDALSSTAAGQLTVWPSDQAIPNTYALSVQPGQSTTNLATVALGATGSISIHNGSSASVNLTAGVEGWFTT